MRVDYSKYGDKVLFWKSVVENAKDFTGTSPPSIFVGSAFYPRVFVGVLLPPKQEESTEILDSPESWYRQKASIADILGYRGQMVYSRFQTRSVRSRPGKLEDVVQEVSLARRSTDVEISLKNKPRFGFNFDNWSSPIGSPAQAIEMRIASNVSVGSKVDYVTSDTDMNAQDAVKNLYERGIEVSRIQKIFSAGMLGLPFQRRFVPTRWGITAVDDIIGKSMMREVRHFPEISEVLLFHSEYLGNHYEILMVPGAYQYELVEMWDSGEWGTNGLSSDYEPNEGRKTYADQTHGAFYSGRLAVMEKLTEMRRQASVLIVREIHRSYDVPVGIWQMRETVRGALQSKPERFATVSQAMLRMSSRLGNGMRWAGRSMLLKNMRQQKRLSSFVVAKQSP